jgi:ATP-dependent DNA helicase PIF1
MVLYLATPCFSHGQLYVALSRVTTMDRFKALIEPQSSKRTTADNIVYRENFAPTQVP